MPLLGSIAGGTPMTNIAYKGWSLFCSLKRAERAFSEETSGLACLPINIQGHHTESAQKNTLVAAAEADIPDNAGLRLSEARGSSSSPLI